MGNLNPISEQATGKRKMSCVEAFSTEEASMYARKMVERESARRGRRNALEDIGRLCGLSAKSLSRLINGETKRPGPRVLRRVREAYLDLCARHIAQLQAELEADKMRYGDHAALADIEIEVSSLAAKLQKAREALK